MDDTCHHYEPSPEVKSSKKTPLASKVFEKSHHEEEEFLNAGNESDGSLV